MLYYATFIAFLVAMAGLAMPLLAGRATVVRKGCGDDCACNAEPRDAAEERP